MATSHTTHTPPQPRPGESPTESPTGAPERPDEVTDALPGWLAGLVKAGFRPWTTMYTLGAIAVVLGILVLSWPGATLLVMAVLFGCYMLVTGVMGLVEGFSDRHAGTGMRVGYVIMGVLGIVLGLYCLRRIDVTVLILAFLLSVFWIMRGIMDISASAARGAVAGGAVAGNGWLAVTGVLTLLAGVVVLFWPGITLSILVAFAGAWLLFYGLLMIFGGFRLHRLAGKA